MSEPSKEAVKWDVRLGEGLRRRMGLFEGTKLIQSEKPGVNLQKIADAHNAAIAKACEERDAKADSLEKIACNAILKNRALSAQLAVMKDLLSEARSRIGDTAWPSLAARIDTALTNLPAAAAPKGEHGRDTARLDWLDAQNQSINDLRGTKYGWQFSINHNRAALMDHHYPPLTVREAIDEAMGAPSVEPKAPSAARGSEFSEGKAFGYDCPVCGEPIHDRQDVRHTDDGLTHEECCDQSPPPSVERQPKEPDLEEKEA